MNIKRSYEFAHMYYDWIIQCLEKDEKWTELAFFRLGVDLGVRQHELASITWEQIEYPYVNNIQMTKKIKTYQSDSTTPRYYEPKEISRQTYDTLNMIYRKGCNGKIFVENPLRYIVSISESAGVEFRGHYMRSIKAKFLAGIDALMSEEDG